jgi:SAM-dependent methyltransferase
VTVAKVILNAVHKKLVFGRRVNALSTALAKVLPRNAKMLDVGTGDGSIAALIMEQRPDVTISGVDVLLRPETHIPVTLFDGSHLPFPDDSFDCVMFVDVLHHTNIPAVLIGEAARVAKGVVVIKDHLLQGTLAGLTLRLMDWVGNRGHDVVLPYNYLPLATWNSIFRDAGLDIDLWVDKLGLYPIPAAWVFDRHLHFVARLSRRRL